MKLHALILLSLFSNILAGQTQRFNNPIALNRADPWVFKDDDGTYYLTATVPEYDRIVLRKAKDINGLKNAPEREIWHKHEVGEMANHIWAPELHKIDDIWYIYFTAADSEDKWKIRHWVLSNPSKDPLKGKWSELGQLKTKQESFSLDATTFVHNGKRYLVWAQNVKGGESGTALLISEMENPTSLKGPEVVLSEPQFGWEKMKYNVNEGPAVIKKNGKIFIAYSASATNHNYCMGLLWIREDMDILQKSNWHKSPGPVFYTNEELKRYGPGHNSFTTAEDGKTTLMFYHARDYKEIKGHELSDPNRATLVREVKWTEDGFPDFMQNEQD